MVEFWEPYHHQWEGEDCYIIGGGPSLSSFDWSLVKPFKVIGCNAAYNLGPEICDIIAFGDVPFWKEHKEGLEQFDNEVVTNLPHFKLHEPPDWLRVMRRIPKGLGTENALGWNSNTGAMALNLALTLGAKRVFLLGFDMKLKDGESNWHDQSCYDPNPEVYERFLRSFQYVADDLPEKYPDREVRNVTYSSGLDLFPKIPVAEHFEEVYQEQSECGSTDTTTGEPCHRTPGWGTDHVGEGRCRYHE